MPSLTALGWGPFFQDQVTGALAGLHIARVIEEQRGLCRVAGDVEGWAEVSGRFRHEAHAASDFPTVGDWVALAAIDGTDRALIHHRFARRSTVSRKTPGRTS